ncbi:hypothetical protein NDU88_000647 [Pleurodeles waltl]|uniref:Uncharacterized protein n=1 Tax=Pleurodeles waltl TaxID=8319 RepID=A0AAV7URX1_PLEWA|nr:hypothetical protein NDU88_000647 [Pleurodeles waltl]
MEVEKRSYLRLRWFALLRSSSVGPLRRVRVFDASADLLGRSKCLVKTTPHGPAAQQSVPRPHHVRLSFYAAPPLQPGPLHREGRDLGRSRDLGSPVALTVSPGFGPGHNGYRSRCRRAQFVFLPSQRPRRPPVFAAMRSSRIRRPSFFVARPRPI